MNDLPSFLLSRQQQAKPVSGMELETFGKHAASLYSSGRCPTVAEAIMATIKTAALSPEQVKRVVELANTEAYLNETRKHASHRYVELQGGPANPADILRDLNDGGEPIQRDKTAMDYRLPPPDVHELERLNRQRLGAPDILEEAFKTSGARYPNDDPYIDSLRHLQKLSGLHDQLVSELSHLEAQLIGDKEELYQQVKEAAQSGLCLGDVLYALSFTEQPADMAKVAFSYITPRLVQDGVHRSALSVAESLSGFTKRAGLVNREHPLLSSYESMCNTLYKLAQTRVAAERIQGEVEAMTLFLHRAISKEAGLAKSVGKEVGELLGVVGSGAKAGWRGLRSGAREAGSGLTEALGGPRMVDAAGNIVSGSRGAELAGKAVEHAPTAALIAAGGLGAEAAHERLRYGQGAVPRTLRGATEHLTAALMPTSEAGMRRRYMVASNQ